ncbi:TPA: autotransporter outer membrane beta-barrel domain-containing protein [Morganella morganii]
MNIKYISLLICSLLLSENAISAVHIRNESNIVLENGDTQNVNAGEAVADTTINNGGYQTVTGSEDSFAHADNTVINDGGVQDVFADGIATGTKINDGGEQNILSSGTANDTVIENGGTQHLYGSDGAIAHADNTLINEGGLQSVSHNSLATGTTINGGEQRVFGDAVDTTINNGGYQKVTGAGHGAYFAHADKTVINEGGVQYVGNNGIASNTVINNQGLQQITNGGKSVNSVINGGGYLEVFLGGTADNTVVNNEGWLILHHGASAADSTTVGTGGNMLMEHGASAGDIDSAGNIIITEGDGSHIVRMGNFKNSGFLSVDGSAIGTTIIVDGNYTGADGHLNFNAVLGDDNSLTDKLVVNGNTAGNTYVSVNNLGGKGDKTLNGIELITVNGESDGIFTRDGRIVAGAYDYSLVRGQEENAKNWYLTSEQNTPDDLEQVHITRPESGSYIANIAAANAMFDISLHDHPGETQYTDALTGEKKVIGLWLRNTGNHNRWRDSGNQLKTRSNSYAVQLGGDIAQWSTDGADRLSWGLMAGYGHNHNKTHASLTGYSSEGDINGYSIGTYGSWFANEDKSGLYTDVWLQYNWFHNHVHGQGLASESYKSKGVTTSFETGYVLPVNKFSEGHNTSEWYFQPRARLTWMNVKADNHRESNGTYVSSDGEGNIQTSLGLRTYIKTEINKGDNIEPFVEMNWLHNTRNYSVKMDDIRITRAGAKNIGEIKLGTEGQINSYLNLWGDVGVQVGDRGYNNTMVMIGAKINL